MKGQNLIPELRFPEFDGIWTKEALRGKVDYLSGYAFGGEVFDEDPDGYPLMRGVNISEGFIRHSLDIDRYFHGSVEKYSKYKLEEGDVVIGMDGSKVGKNAALIGHRDTGALLVQRVARLRETDNANLRFIYQHILSTYFIRYVEKVKTSSGIPHISGKQIEDFKIFFPSLPEQEKIASFLTAVDRRIQLLKEKKAALEKYKAGVMQQLFSQQIRFKVADGSEFPDWEERKLGEVATFSKGRGISKSNIDENGSNECIRYGELYTHYNEVIDKVISKTNIPKEELTLSERNDVIIPASGETQIDIATASCILNEGIAIGSDLNIIRSDINGVFLSYYLNFVKKHDIARLSQGISVVHLYGSQLQELKISFPSNVEQERIVDYLRGIDQKLSLTLLLIDQVSSFKHGLLQKMFV